MITENGRVVGIEPQHLIVEVLKTSACQSCRARQACGQAVLSEWGSPDAQAKKNHFLVRYTGQANLGDVVVLGMSETLLSKVTALLYLLPLAISFLCLLLANSLGAAELFQFVSFVSGLLLSYLVIARISVMFQSSLEPHILRMYSSGTELGRIASSH